MTSLSVRRRSRPARLLLVEAQLHADDKFLKQCEGGPSLLSFSTAILGLRLLNTAAHEGQVTIRHDFKFEALGCHVWVDLGALKHAGSVLGCQVGTKTRPSPHVVNADHPCVCGCFPERSCVCSTCSH